MKDNQNLIKIKYTDRRHSEEAKIKMREKARLRKGTTSFYGKNHISESILKISIKKSISVIVQNVELDTHKIFFSNKKAADYLNVGLSTLRRYKKLNKLIKGKYLVYNL